MWKKISMCGEFARKALFCVLNGKRVNLLLIPCISLYAVIMMRTSILPGYKYKSSIHDNEIGVYVMLRKQHIS